MKTRNWLWGIFFICAAALLVMNQLGYFIGIGLFSLLFTIILVPIIVKSIVRLNFFGIFFPTSLLLIIFDRPLGIQALTPWTVIIASILLSIGLSVIFKPKSFGHHGYVHHHHNHNHPEEVIGHVDDDNVNCTVSFSSRSQYLHSDHLQKARLSCSFGSLKVFFDNTQLDVDGAELYVNCSFGTIELYIPKEWNIIYDVGTSVASIDEKNHHDPSNGPMVKVSGDVSFGSISVTYV